MTMNRPPNADSTLDISLSTGDVVRIELSNPRPGLDQLAAELLRQIILPRMRALEMASECSGKENPRTLGLEAGLTEVCGIIARMSCEELRAAAYLLIWSGIVAQLEKADAEGAGQN